MLSTSLVGYTTVLGAVAPMVPHGYGFFYRIRDDRLVHICLSHRKNYKDMFLIFVKYFMLYAFSILEYILEFDSSVWCSIKNN